MKTNISRESCSTQNEYYHSQTVMIICDDNLLQRKNQAISSIDSKYWSNRGFQGDGIMTVENTDVVWKMSVSQSSPTPIVQKRSTDNEFISQPKSISLNGNSNIDNSLNDISSVK